MRIALIGYGKMGKTIHKLAIEKGHQISVIIDEDNKSQIISLLKGNVDVAIEFSTPNSVIDNIKACLEAHVPIVVGTTGWYEAFNDVKNQVELKSGSVFYSTNFSIGVNLFWKAAEILSKLTSGFESYKASIEEIHHTAKLDKPSGTAITLAEKVLPNTPFHHWNFIENNDQNSLPIKSLRMDDVPGIHTLKFESSIDSISITHEAFSRDGFAIGSITAAEWLVGKSGIYSMNDMLTL